MLRKKSLLVLFTIVIFASAMLFATNINLASGTGYSATIEAYCENHPISDSAISVSIDEDGVPSGFNTPHTFEGLTGTHTFTVPTEDDSGHPFVRWYINGSDGIYGLTSTTITVSGPWNNTYAAHYSNIEMFVDPETTIGDLTPPPVPYQLFKMKVNVSNVPEPGMWADQFFLQFDPNVLGKPFTPLVNPNFTDTGSTAWTTTATGTGTATYGYDIGDGNPSPGSGAPSYYHRATSTAGATASLTFVTEQTFSLGSAFKPNGDGTYTAWTNDYTYWDDMPADGATSYVYTSTNGAQETSTLEDPPVGETRSILWVTVYVRAADTSTTGDDLIRIMIRSRGVDYFAPAASDINPTTVYTTYSYTWGATHPGGGAWTWNDITNLQAGVQYIQVGTSATAIRVTQMYVDASSWPGTPLWAGVSYAYKISGNSIAASGNNFGMRVQRPDGTELTLITTTSFTGTTPLWTYNVVKTAATAFTAPGTYKFRLRNVLVTAATGTDKYVQFNWDDVGLKIAPITVAEGEFLQSAGATETVVKYLNETTIYFGSTISGTPYSPSWPVTGSGTLAYFTFTVKYGATWLNLTGLSLTERTKVLKVGDPPGYPTIEMDHTLQDGFFNNKIPGDSDGNGRVNVVDIAAINGHWWPTPTPAYPPEYRLFDNDDNGAINVVDIAIINANWGRIYVDP